MGACLDTEVIRVLGAMRGGIGFGEGGGERNAGPHRRRKDNQKMGGRRRSLRWVDKDTGFMPTVGPQIAEDNQKMGGRRSRER